MSLDKQKIKKKNSGLLILKIFCGFVIHITENDEFIGEIEETPFGKIIGYTPIT